MDDRSTYQHRFRFVIGQTVRIIPIDTKGLILERVDRGQGRNEYFVDYWLDGKNYREWLVTGYLEAAK
jgi:hypothetical protein